MSVTIFSSGDGWVLDRRVGDFLVCCQTLLHGNGRVGVGREAGCFEEVYDFPRWTAACEAWASFEGLPLPHRGWVRRSLETATGHREEQRRVATVDDLLHRSLNQGVVVDRGPSFEVVAFDYGALSAMVDRGRLAIRCLRCGSPFSHHPKDVVLRYCSGCGRLHESLLAAAAPLDSASTVEGG